MEETASSVTGIGSFLPQSLHGLKFLVKGQQKKPHTSDPAELIKITAHSWQERAAVIHPVRNKLPT